MTLDAYLTARELTEASFAELVGVEQSTINRLRKGQIPSPRVMTEIARVTDGHVTPNDFFGITPAPAKRTRPAEASAVV